MTRGIEAISYVDGPRLRSALHAGIMHVFQRREHLNRINVFPVPDGDTGTNMAFTFKAILDAVGRSGPERVDELLGRVAEAALDGARGNSGAIMAQYFQGMREAAAGSRVVSADTLAAACRTGAQAAWKAMSRPVPGTLPTVLEDFGDELARRVEDGIEDIRQLMQRGIRRARHSLAETPNQLAVLKDAGVVDAGAQGFVDLLEGIWRYMRSGKVPVIKSASESPGAFQPGGFETSAPEQHRFCTECLLEGQALDVVALRQKLDALDASSLVVAGGGRRARVHIHTDSPGDVFRICSGFGEIRQQKADDMTRQHGLMNQRGQVAIVTDSAADLPAEEIDRLGIHVVPVRLNFADQEYLDKLTISPAEFYRKLSESTDKPQTSQPPPADFRRQFELLTSHGLEVLALQISGRLSGTLQAARTAAGMIDDERIEVFDTLNGASGQGLMVLWAAEASIRGWERTAIVARLKEMRADFRTFALVRDLSWGVRGGRVKPWMETISRKLGLNPVLSNTPEGLLGARGVIAGRRRVLPRFARYLLKRMHHDRVYRIMISHTDALSDARDLRDRLLDGHPQVDACWIEDASPAIGVHAGPGSLLIGLQPWIAPEDRRA